MGIIANESNEKITSSLTLEELSWILKVIRESKNLRGADLQTAVETISKLQNMIKE